MYAVTFFSLCLCSYTDNSAVIAAVKGGIVEAERQSRMIIFVCSSVKMEIRNDQKLVAMSGVFSPSLRLHIAWTTVLFYILEMTQATLRHPVSQNIISVFCS